MIEKRLGERLIETGAVTDAQLRQALERQRTAGGRIGENLIALGFLTQAQLDACFKQHPRPPAGVEETGLDLSFISDLVLKHAAVLRTFGLPEMSDSVKLPYGVVDEALEALKRQRMLEVRGSADFSRLSLRYAITQGGTSRADTLLDMCRYTGPAPVTIDDYRAMTRVQTIKHVVVSEESVRAAFSHLVIREDLLQRLGPAVSAGKSLFVYGPPGNGKTTIAETIGGILPGTVYLPYAVLVGGQIITVFDGVNHRPAPAERPDGEVDPRWVLCRRPIILAGGELTLQMLDLDFNAVTKFYEAPLQMKANNGLFIVDDFGRQRVEPKALLNRWIVPLERRTDFLGLHSGIKFEVPFDQLVVFSTNLPPETLVDEAFLRRIRYKIKVDRPSRDEYEAIFRLVCDAYAVEFRKDVFDHLLEHYYAARGVPLNACHPRDIVEHIVDHAHYARRAPELTRETVASAWESYFVTGETPVAPD